MLVVFDDILVYSRNWEERLLHVRVVLNLLGTNTLYAKESKCYFGVDQVEYLRHFIFGRGKRYVITVFRSTWKTKQNMESPPIFFCLGVIEHRKDLSFYKK